MAYMDRLGLWGPGTEFANFQKFLEVVEQCGFGLMELCAMDMKLRGMYMARQLSFKDAIFENREIATSPEMKSIHDDSVELVSNFCYRYVYSILTNGL